MPSHRNEFAGAAIRSDALATRIESFRIGCQPVALPVGDN
jgi:hypothetical protein